MSLEMLRDYLNGLLPRVDADACCLFLRSGNGDIFELIIGLGVSRRYALLLQYVRVGHGFVGRTAETGEMRVSECVDTDSRFRRRVTAAEGYHSAISVPLLENGYVTGILLLLWEEAQKYSNTYIRDLKRKSGEIADEVRLVRVVTETRRRSRSLEILYRLGSDIYGLLDHRQIGEIAVNEIKAFLDIDTYILYICWDNNERYVISGGAWSGHENQVIDATTDETDNLKVTTLESDLLKLPKKISGMQIMAVPIVFGNQNLGRIIVGFVAGLETWEKEFLQQVGRIIGVAVANYNMFRAQDTLATTLERGRISKEFHDSIGQMLGGIILEVNLAKEMLKRMEIEPLKAKFEQITEMLGTAYDEVRSIIIDLEVSKMAVNKGSDDFVSILRGYLKNYMSRTGIRVSTRFPRRDLNLPKSAEIQLLRIIQEALNNTWKHARASKVEVQLSVLNKNLNIKVRDNGCGISVDEAEATSANSQHFGLSIMRDRAESIGGSFSITSSPHEGTCVMVSFPLQQAN